MASSVAGGNGRADQKRPTRGLTFPPDAPLEEPRTLEATRDTLARTVAAMGNGTLDERIGGQIINGCRVLLPVLEKLDLAAEFGRLKSEVERLKAAKR